MSRAEPRVRKAGRADLPFLWEMLGDVLAWAPDRPATREELLCARSQGRPALSLSADPAGRPGRLHERLGFRVCGRDASGDPVRMRLDRV